MRVKDPRYYLRWPGRHTGKYWKRKLSKLRRRYWKDERHQRGLPAAMSEVNYKTW